MGELRGKSALVHCICGHVSRDFDEAITHVIESAGLPGGPHEVWNPDPPNQTIGGEQTTAAASNEASSSSAAASGEKRSA